MHSRFNTAIAGLLGTHLKAKTDQKDLICAFLYIILRKAILTPNQLEALATKGESETQEFKRTTGTRKEAAETMCAMLNQRGGHVLFGVTPEGNVVGQQVAERTIEEVSAEIQRIDRVPNRGSGADRRESRGDRGPRWSGIFAALSVPRNRLSARWQHHAGHVSQ